LGSSYLGGSIVGRMIGSSFGSVGGLYSILGRIGSNLGRVGSIFGSSKRVIEDERHLHLEFPQLPSPPHLQILPHLGQNMCHLRAIEQEGRLS
jgi:hypothetical protein